MTKINKSNESLSRTACVLLHKWLKRWTFGMKRVMKFPEQYEFTWKRWKQKWKGGWLWGREGGLGELAARKGGSDPKGGVRKGKEQLESHSSLPLSLTPSPPPREKKKRTKCNNNSARAPPRAYGACFAHSFSAHISGSRREVGLKISKEREKGGGGEKKRRERRKLQRRRSGVWLAA